MLFLPFEINRTSTLPLHGDFSKYALDEAFEGSTQRCARAEIEFLNPEGGGPPPKQDDTLHLWEAISILLANLSLGRWEGT